jgi:hypothetical protein
MFIVVRQLSAFNSPNPAESFQLVSAHTTGYNSNSNIDRQFGVEFNNLPARVPFHKSFGEIMV